MNILLVSVAIILVTYAVFKLLQNLAAGRCKSAKCLVGRTAIVTGGSSGLGFETALALASRGCRVIIADRNTSKEPVEEIIRRTTNPNVELRHLDLASFASVRKFARAINESEERLDILVNNAGIDSVGGKYTKDGLHPTMQVNHFGPFLLTHLLVGLLKKSAPSRVIFVSSLLVFFATLTLENLNYPEHTSADALKILDIYANSKLCNIITSKGFARRLKTFGVTSNAAEPKAVMTNIISSSFQYARKDFFYLLGRCIYFIGIGLTPEEGAQTAIHLSLSDEVENVTGKFFGSCRELFTPKQANDEKFCEDIWKQSEILSGLAENELLLEE